MLVFGVVILCTMLPSQAVFTALVSVGGVLNVGAYGLIGLLRFTMTPNLFESTHFNLGKFRKQLYLATALWNAFAFAVSWLGARFDYLIVTFILRS